MTTSTPRRRAGRAGAVALAAAVVGGLLAACSGRTLTRGPSHGGALAAPESGTASSAPLGSGRAGAGVAPVVPLDWQPCGGHPGWDCATLQVPLDYAHPGTTIGIALNRHRASNPTSRVGSLLLNPGGPGASGIDFAYAAADGLLEPVLVKDFDIIGFDPRGVGASDPVSCVDGPTLDRINHLDPDPDTGAELTALVAGAQQLDAGCEAHSGAELPHVSTVDAARDLDEIRAAVGDAKLTYLGFSYGTLLGATYASLFPTHIRALALDAAIDPAVDDNTMALDQAMGFEKDLDDFLADCAAQGAGCAFHAAGAPSLRAAFDALVARIDASPLPGTGGRTVGPGEAFVGIIAPLYDRQTWPVLAEELTEAQHGSGRLLLQQYDDYSGRNPDGTYDNEEVANTAVNCEDHARPSLGGLQALAATLRRKAPYFGGPIAWGSLNCVYWPATPVTHTGPLRAPGAPPIMVVGSTGDPVTPYSAAQGLAAELGSGVLVTRHGDGHAGYPASQCVRNVVDNYLISLVVPTRADADCAS